MSGCCLNHFCNFPIPKFLNIYFILILGAAILSPVKKAWLIVDNLFTVSDPELDLDYLLDPSNRDTIKQNISDRKGVGNIDQVVSKICHVYSV